MTGKRLAELAIPFTTIVRSTMTRAQETSKIIEKSLGNIPVEDDSLIIEGAPIPPEPPIGNWRAEKYVSFLFFCFYFCFYFVKINFNMFFQVLSRWSKN